jgi:pantoate--beta-alanine ligase
MKVLSSPEEVRAYRRQFPVDFSLGFVPTMGALHEGHLQLATRARKENEAFWASIFVNPIQFNNAQDLANYPIKTEEDLALLDAAGCDAVFLPTPENMYPQPARTVMHFRGLDDRLEGEKRPGHFSGVGVVVSKLFNLVQPKRAYFGEKDIQQLQIIRQMVRDLSFDIEIIGVPTVREEDGLARSSRNLLLRPEERQLAPTLHRILQAAKAAALEGQSAEAITKNAEEALTKAGFRPEYVRLVSAESLDAPTLPLKGEFILCAAAQLGNVRLIDNLIFSV